MTESRPGQGLQNQISIFRNSRELNPTISDRIYIFRQKKTFLHVYNIFLGPKAHVPAESSLPCINFKKNLFP